LFCFEVSKILSAHCIHIVITTIDTMSYDLYACHLKQFISFLQFK